MLAQFILANISAAIYAYKFTHFYDPPALLNTSQNIFRKTWKLFTGPNYYKNINEPEPLFAYTNINLKTNDDISIDAWYAAGSASTCVIFLHGYSVNKSYVRDEASMFQKWGYSVLMFDLRGHGKSSGNSTTYGIKETADLQKAFEFAKSKGHRKIILYGVSLGAAISIKATADGKVQPDAIIADMPLDNLHQHFKARTKMLGFPSEPFASLITFWVGVEKGYNAFNHDVSTYAKKVSCPVLIQWGEKDIYVPEKGAKSIFNNLASKKKKLAVYPNADHESFLQNDPLTWEREVPAFLESIQ